MSQTSKRPGARDISDLKARLGLKKSGGAAGQKPAPGGIVPPPGANLGGGVIPAPPGMSPPQPHIPDASRDPFGAMGAMAQHAATTTARPDIVVVNDGKPVESVEGAKGVGRLAKVAAMVVLPLAAGLVVGKVSEGANQYNRVIEDAGPVKEDVGKVRRGLTELQAALEGGKKAGKFLPGDDKLTKALGAVPPIEGDHALVYGSALYQLEPAMVAEIYGFYTDINTLNAMLKEHVFKAKSEARTLKEGMAKFQSFNPMQYGALLSMPSEEEAAAGQPVTLKMVKLGRPVCEGQKKPSETGCPPGKVAGFQFQTDETGNWQVKSMAKAEGTTVEDDTLLMLNPDSAVLKQVIRGGEATVAEASYDKRITAIDELVTRMLDSGKKIETLLNEKSHESGKFTFFL